MTLEDIVYFQGEEQLASAPTAPGSYTASLTVTGGDGTNNTITLNYKIVLKITLDPGEGTLADGVDAFLFTDTAGKLTGELPAPTGGGCAFEGWYTEGGEQVTGETVFTQNTTVYASYQTHTPTQISVGTPATCTEDGEKGYFQCTSCSRYFADEACKELIGDNTALEAWLAGDAIIPAGHTYGQWIEEIPAQCTETGTLGHYTCSGCSKNFDAEKQELSSLEIPALNHTFGTVTPYKAETCVEDGTKAYKQCETCQLYFAGDAENNATDGKEKAEDFAIPATGHNPAKTEQVDANCTTDGVKAYWYCDWCKKYFSNEDCTAEIADLDSWKLDGGKISALGHAFAATFTVDKKASCDAAGSKSRHCSRCEAVTDETIIQQRTHALVDTDVAKNATCTENGTMNQKCSHGSSEEYEACAYTTQRVIPATGHTFGEITPYKTATCLENGTEAYKQCETCHLYFAESAKSDAADGKAKAEDFAIPAMGHTFGEITPYKAAKCEEDGTEAYKQCETCQLYFAGDAEVNEGDGKEEAAAFVIGKLNHDFAATFTVDKKASCDAAGSKSRHCSRCEATTEETVIPQRTHNLVDTDVAKNATCTENGTMNQKCSHAASTEYEACAYTTQRVIPAMGHDFAATFTVDKKASCDAAGSKSRHCSRCEAVTDETIIQQRTHNLVDTDVAKNATCTENGTMNQKCSHAASEEYEACAYTTQREIPAMGHDFAATFTVDKKASCDAAGSKSRHCSRCEATTEETVIQQRTHNLVDTDVAKNATCTENGTMNQKCDHGSSEEYEACAYTTQRTIPATGHTFGEITPYKTATCLENGTEAYKQCETCHLYFAESAKSDATDGKAKAEDFAIPATGHTFGEITPYKAAKCEEDGTEAYKQCETCQLYFAGDAEGNEGDGKEESAAFVIGKLNHDFAATFTVDKKASCDAAGSKSRHCSRCEAVTDETVIPQRTHNLVDTDVAKAATCTENGTMNQKCSHAASDEYEACAYTTTRELPIDPANHASDEVEFLNVWTATCAAEGYTGDIYHACCGALKQAGTTVPRLAHTEATREENRVEATCGADGTYELVTYCQVCEEELSRESKSLPATGNHRFETEMKGTRVPATCVTAGTVTMQCSCGAETQISLELNAENHENVVTDAGKTPTCTAEGLTEGSHCEACGAIITAQTALKATGHQEVQHEEKPPPAPKLAGTPM